MQTTTNDGMRDATVKRQTRLQFHDATAWTFQNLAADPKGLRDNLIDYIAGFNRANDVLKRFRFEREIVELAESNRLLPLVRRSVSLTSTSLALERVDAVCAMDQKGERDPDSFVVAGVEELARGACAALRARSTGVVTGCQRIGRGINVVDAGPRMG